LKKIKVDYKENIKELDEFITENRILNKKIKTSEMKADELVIQVESLQNKYDKIQKNNLEHLILRMMMYLVIGPRISTLQILRRPAFHAGCSLFSTYQIRSLRPLNHSL